MLINVEGYILCAQGMNVYFRGNGFCVEACTVQFCIDIVQNILPGFALQKCLLMKSLDILQS